MLSVTSRKVQGLKRIHQRLHALQRTLEIKKKALVPLEREITKLTAELLMRQGRLTGTQLGQWRQYLDGHGPAAPKP